MSSISSSKNTKLRWSYRSDFYDLGASVFTKSELRFLKKNIISDMVFFKKCNADF